MITARRTRLVRVPDLHAFRHAIADLVIESAGSPRRPPLVVVPTRGAGRQLSRLLERDPARSTADVVTRDELYGRLHERLDNPPPRLTSLEREVMMQRAAREAAGLVPELGFRIRPGLVAGMLRFYDHLRLRLQQVNRFAELIEQALEGDELDRGARRMRDQTRFLAEAFRGYEQAVAVSAACDEHVLRDRLVAEAAADPVRHVIVTVSDWIADPDGLFAADFDLLARIPGLAALDLVATERVLGSGFDERIHEWWPGVEDITRAELGRPYSERRADQAPVIVVPSDRPADQPWWTFRDREEELVSSVRRIKADRRHGVDILLDRRAVVFKTPLPYLYLASEVFPAARIAFQTCHALPLAVEPAVAALDLVLDAVSNRFARAPLIALLRSPHLTFSHAGAIISRESIGALNAALSQRQYLGEVDRLTELAANWPHANAIPALQAALSAARQLAPLIEARAASEQVACLRSFWDAHCLTTATSAQGYSGPPKLQRRREDAEDAEETSFACKPAHGGFRDRERRARAAIAQTLSSLASAHAAHDDPLWTIEDLALAVRRALEDQTFEPDSSSMGVHLVDDQAARYGDFDEVALVGLIESDWPERPSRNIFYPSGLLRVLGWPSEKDRRVAADARFLDLLGSASRRTLVSTFTLEDDALVARSAQLDEIPRARLSSVAYEPTADARVFVDEALSLDPPVLQLFEGPAREWAELRVSRSPADDPRFHGRVGRVGQAGRVGQVGQDGTAPRPVTHLPTPLDLLDASTQPAPPTPPDLLDPRDLHDLAAFSVSALETYLECPFKFFAQHVLKLQDEPEDQEVMDPKQQGRFLHQVFEEFFRTWHGAGEGAITPQNLARARALFTEVVDRAIEELPGPEAALERTRLLGSPAAAGLGEAVLRMEAERPARVVERLLEHDLSGEVSLSTPDGSRKIRVRGRADRVDLLDSGTFRVIDYKLGWPPNRTRALQLPIYSLCAEQRMAGHRGRDWRLGEAVYLAFKGPRRVVPLASSDADRTKVIAEAQQRLVQTVDAVARADFPPAPDDVWRCETCSFSSVCRKDYVGGH